jgi:hypothetical protein
MRGKKSTYEEKELKGTLNKTRDRDKTKVNNSDPEISEYLNKIKIMLDMLWQKINNKDIQDNVEQLEKYSRQFIMWQRHYFTYKNLAPKSIEDDDVISELLKNKEL